MTMPVYTVWTTRPHWASPQCWCMPRMVECEAGCECGLVVGHRFVDVLPDNQPRMGAFSR